MLCPAWGPLGKLPGRSLGAPWRPLGPAWANLGPILSVWGPSGGLLSRLGGPLGPSWVSLGGLLVSEAPGERLRPSWIVWKLKRRARQEPSKKNMKINVFSCSGPSGEASQEVSRNILET
eukprot:7532772-Pyramimonas_sp.AAC.1